MFTKSIEMQTNQGLELLYTPDCRAWQQAKINLEQALEQAGLSNEGFQVIVVETMEQARAYNFFASPTIHINGLDVEPQGRRIKRRGLGVGRPYFYQGQILAAPPVELIKSALKELF